MTIHAPPQPGQPKLEAGNGNGQRENEKSAAVYRGSPLPLKKLVMDAESDREYQQLQVVDHRLRLRDGLNTHGA
jgi:hypothetical protein